MVARGFRNAPTKFETGWADLFVRVVSAIASVGVGLAGVSVLLMGPNEGVTDYGTDAPMAASLALELLCAGFVGLIGAVRGSRPLIGAAGGLTLILGFSLLVVPAVLLIAACGIAPARRAPKRHEFVAGLLSVVFGLSIFLVPAVLASPGCWVAVNTSRGVEVQVVRGPSEDLPSGPEVAGCAEKIPPVNSFQIGLVFAVAALASVTVSAGRPLK
jgi:hypothetical protein